MANKRGRTRPIRFLFCNYEFPPLGGGGGTACRYLAREITRRGHFAEVVTARFAGQAPEFRKGRFRLRRLPCLRRQAGQSNPIEMLSYVASAAPYLLLRRGPRPDVALSFHSIPSGIAAWPLSLVRGTPHIVSFRGGDVPGWLPGELELYHKATLWLNRLIVYSSARALANSDGLRALAQESFPNKPIGVLSNGVDITAHRPPDEGRAHRHGPVRLIFVGRITTQKGVDLLIDSLGDGELRGRDWTLDLIGDGPMLAAYQEQAAALGIADRIQFHGWLERPAVRELYRAADLFVFPSRYEGMPNVVLEAMASGLPVLGTRIAGTEELVDPEINGLLIDPDDGQGLRRELCRLLDDRDLRLRLGAMGRDMVVRDWSWAARAKELEAIALELIG